MTVILTEKPSVAADFARALGAKPREGHYESQQYIITYAFGHLLDLYEPGDYDTAYGRPWRMEVLPIIPEKFYYKPIEKSKDQLEHIRKLLGMQSVREVILATDAGREGELIGRVILGHCGFTDRERIKRFWSSEALTPEVVKRGMSNLRPLSETDALYQTGRFRRFADWVVGVNFSRFFSLAMNNRFSVGRVQTAVLGLLCKRQREIENFKPETYYQLQGIFEKRGVHFRGTYRHQEKTKFESKDLLLPVVQKALAKAERGVVKALHPKENRKPAPLLLNLTGLQQEANKRFGYSAEETLSVAQALYETQKCLSYPRTPSRVMGSGDVSFVTERAKALATSYGDLFSRFQWERLDAKNKRVFNDEHLEDHHALVPLGPAPAELSEKERNVYNIVLRYFVGAFYPDYQYVSTEAEIDVDEAIFISSGVMVRDPGWTAVVRGSSGEEETKDKEQLPELKEGDQVVFVEANIEEKKTDPPKWFTEATLLAAMEHPNKFREHENVEFDKDTGLGTPATRADTIAALVERDYVVRERKRLRVTAKGLHLYDAVQQSGLVAAFSEVETTAQWEEYLSQVPDQFFANLQGFVSTAVKSLREKSFARFEDPSQMIGSCPKCGAGVTENKRKYYCSGHAATGCDWELFKEVSWAKVPPQTAKRILEKGESGKMKFWSRKKEKYYYGKLKLDEKGNVRIDVNGVSQESKGKKAVGSKR